MSLEQLDQIESALGFQLPNEYRLLATQYPFKPVGRDAVYWFFNDPQRVIEETRFPLCDSEYSGAGWKPSFLLIGHSPAGDVYVMDTAVSELPVLLLDHETHEIEPQWATLHLFVEEWKTFWNR
jgi:hypothetical protein